MTPSGISITLQDILNSAFPAYAVTHRQPLHVHQAVRALRRCRTGALGRHARRCPNGHVVDLQPNSCRHRSCPQCGGRKAAQWLAQWEARLLPTPHFHVIMTLSPVLHGLWRWNRRRFADALFRAGRDALVQLLAQERHLGARPGVLIGLHTWGSALPVHPHLHCLVTAGGVDAAGRWRASRAHFLLWAPILRTVFRAKLLAALEELLTQHWLVLPPPLDEPHARALLAAAAQTDWHVRIEPPYAHGRGLVVYLARYLRSGPIKNHRLVSYTEGTVCFRYRDYRAAGRPKWRTMPLPVDEFLDRVCAHVPAPGLHLVRAYGLYASHERPALERCRVQLQPGWQRPAPVPPPAPAPCPHCGAPLRFVVIERPPPRARHGEKPTGPGPPSPVGMFN